MPTANNGNTKNQRIGHTRSSPTPLCDFCKDKLSGNPYGVIKNGKKLRVCGEKCVLAVDKQ